MKNYQTAEYDKHYIDWLKEQNEKMAKLVFHWHPYPQTTPTRNFVEYLVTYREDENLSVGISAYGGIVEDRFLAVSNVVAWAELPKPYGV